MENTKNAVKLVSRLLENERAGLRAAKQAHTADERERERRIAELVKLRDVITGGRRVRVTADLDPHAQAGAENVIRMEDVFRVKRICSQAEVAREADVSRGTVTWGIRALLADGLIEPTGEKVGVSKVYRWKGGRRRTRVAPGEA